MAYRNQALLGSMRIVWQRSSLVSGQPQAELRAFSELNPT